jgi:predicted S18 family serine protease
MNKINTLYVLVIGLILLNAYFLFSHFNSGMPPRPPMRGDFKQELIEELQLDETQAKTLNQLARRHHQHIQQLEDSILDAKESYYTASLGEQDSVKSKLYLNQIIALHQKIEQVNIAHFSEIRNLCKTEQRAKFNSLIPRIADFFRNPGTPPPPRP